VLDAVHSPSWQTVPVPQRPQVVPLIPQAEGELPASHLPVALQHPPQVAALHVVMGVPQAEIASRPGSQPGETSRYETWGAPVSGLIGWCARGGSNPYDPPKGLRILSPLRLPVSPLAQGIELTV